MNPLHRRNHDGAPASTQWELIAAVASHFIEPCLPSPGEQPPTGSGWVHEIKHDGYRLMARRDALSVGIRLLTRNHQQGAYNGREAEWARLEHDIIRAGAEGRIRGAVDLHGK
jgi:ATP-dependent DNA ligase